MGHNDEEEDVGTTRVFLEGSYAIQHTGASYSRLLGGSGSSRIIIIWQQPNMAAAEYGSSRIWKRRTSGRMAFFSKIRVLRRSLSDASGRKSKRLGLRSAIVRVRKSVSGRHATMPSPPIVMTVPIALPLDLELPRGRECPVADRRGRTRRHGQCQGPAVRSWRRAQQDLVRLVVLLPPAGRTCWGWHSVASLFKCKRLLSPAPPVGRVRGEDCPEDDSPQTNYDIIRGQARGSCCCCCCCCSGWDV
jgi:hypothetical protein